MRTLLIGLGLSTLLLSASAPAQTQRSGSDTTRVVQQVQQLTAEKSKLQQDNDSLKKEIEELKAKYGQASAEQGKLQQRARELEAASNKQQVSSRSNDEALEKYRTQLQELVTKFRETAQSLKEVEQERDVLRTEKSAQERQLSSCVDRNAQMYLLSDEVLGRMQQQGLWSSLKGKEPFTQLSRARLENLVEDYRYRINELRLSDKTAAPATAAVTPGK